MSDQVPPGVLLDRTRDKVAVLDEDGRITYVNEAVERLLDWEPDELVGRNAFDYIHPADVDETRAAFERLVDSETFVEGTAEYRFRAADGSWVPFEASMSNLTDEALDGYVISSREITDLVEIRRDRDETTDRLRELSATTGDVLWMFSADWSELLFVNPAYEEVYGRPVEELRRNPEMFLRTIHPDDVPAVRDAMERLSAGEPIDMEYRVNPDLDYGVWVWVQAEPIVEEGEVVRITGFSRDVTDRHRRTRQLCVMDNLLRHNLRNDLNIVLGETEHIEEQAPEVRDRTAVIRRTSETLLASAEKQRDIIGLLRGETCRDRVDVVEAVEEAVAVIRDRFEADIEVSTPDEAPACVLEEIGLAVVELLENAIVHGRHHREPVSVVVDGGAGERVELTVEDDGPPIPDIEAAVLTGSHDMDDIYHSTGLGLWLVYWVVELSGGHIEVEAGDAGNRIEVVLPGPTE